MNFSIKLFSEGKDIRLYILYKSFTSQLHIPPTRPVSVVRLTLNLTFAANYPLLTKSRTNLLSGIPSMLFDTVKKTPKYHRVDRAFKLVSIAILPNCKFVGPWSCVVELCPCWQLINCLGTPGERPLLFSDHLFIHTPLK